jgi:hypothetical protein
VIGRPVPLWVTGTTTIENAERTLAYNQIFTALDTVPEGPPTQARLEQAVKTGLASEYPAGFAALAADAAQGLRTLRGGHEKTPDSEGWYLVCRPARPSPSMELEQLITGARVVEDLALVGKDLVELRRAERDLLRSDPRGDLYQEAATLPVQQLRAAERTSTERRYTAIADDELAIYSAPGDPGTCWSSSCRRVRCGAWPNGPCPWTSWTPGPTRPTWPPTTAVPWSPCSP